MQEFLDFLGEVHSDVVLPIGALAVFFAWRAAKWWVGVGIIAAIVVSGGILSLANDQSQLDRVWAKGAGAISYVIDRVAPDDPAAKPAKK